jgi:hypothetical protein
MSVLLICTSQHLAVQHATHSSVHAGVHYWALMLIDKARDGGQRTYFFYSNTCITKLHTELCMHTSH